MVVELGSGVEGLLVECIRCVLIGRERGGGSACRCIMNEEPRE